MSRLNLDDKLWSDARFDALKNIVGSELLAIGMVIKSFRIAQEYWKTETQLIPFDIWDMYNFSAMEKVGLAEKLDNGVYIKGSNEQFDWIKKKQLAGKISAEKRRLKFGSAQPVFDKSPNTPRTAFEQVFEKPRTATEPPTLNYNYIIPPPKGGPPVKVVSAHFASLGARWVTFGQRQIARLAKDANWTPEIIGLELEKAAKKIGYSYEQMVELFEFIEADEFWSKNAVSPFGFFTKSKNGLRKIDNVITAFEKQNKTTYRVDPRMDRSL